MPCRSCCWRRRSGGGRLHLAAGTRTRMCGGVTSGRRSARSASAARRTASCSRPGPRAPDTSSACRRAGRDVGGRIGLCARLDSWRARTRPRRGSGRGWSRRADSARGRSRRRVTRSTAASGTETVYHCCETRRARARRQRIGVLGSVVASPQSLAWTTMSCETESDVQRERDGLRGRRHGRSAGGAACAAAAGTRHTHATASSRTSLRGTRRGIAVSVRGRALRRESAVLVPGDATRSLA